jgi:hypothetical protein
MIDLVQSVFDILCLSVSPDRPEWLLPLLGWKAFNQAVGAVTGAVNSVVNPRRGGSGGAGASSGVSAQQIQQLQNQIAAANKAAADAEKARLAQEAEAKRQQMIREYDQAAGAKQKQSVTAAKDQLSRMNKMREESDASAMEDMRQTADSAGSKAMGIGGETFDSLDYSRLGGFANSYDPAQQRRGRAAAQFMKTEDGNVNRFVLPDMSNLTFGGA